MSDDEYVYTLLNEAAALDDGGRFYEAIALLDRVLAVDADDLVVAEALTRKARLFRALGRIEDATAMCDAVLERFGDDPELAVSVRYYRAVATYEEGRHEQALAHVDEILGDGLRADHPLVADALLLKALTLVRLERPTDALALYDEVAERGGDEPTVATALAWKAELLGDLHRYEEGLAVARHVAARFDGASEPTTRLRVASALLRVGSYLEDTGQRAAAIDAYRRLLDGFRPDEPQLEELLAWAREQYDALRVLHALRGPRLPVGVGAAALLIFTVYRRTSRRREL